MNNNNYRSMIQLYGGLLMASCIMLLGKSQGGVGQSPPTATATTARFYIYEWPPQLADVYPPMNTTLDKKSKYDHSFNENNGAGKLLVPELGLFQTWQFSLFKNVFSRLRTSKYRTR